MINYESMFNWFTLVFLSVVIGLLFGSGVGILAVGKQMRHCLEPDTVFIHDTLLPPSPNKYRIESIELENLQREKLRR